MPGDGSNLLPNQRWKEGGERCGIGSRGQQGRVAAGIIPKPKKQLVIQQFPIVRFHYIPLALSSLYIFVRLPPSNQVLPPSFSLSLKKKNGWSAEGLVAGEYFQVPHTHQPKPNERLHIERRHAERNKEKGEKKTNGELWRCLCQGERDMSGTAR